MKNSNFLPCMECRGRCCNGFDRLNPPLFSKPEFEIVTGGGGCESGKFKLFDGSQNFYHPIMAGKVCPLLTDKGCGIYEHRPLDCKLFPFCVGIKDGEIWLSLHYSFCIDRGDKKLAEKIINANATRAVEMAMSYGIYLFEYANISDFQERDDNENPIWIQKLRPGR